MVPIRHSRAGGNPGIFELNARLRGSDVFFCNLFVGHDTGTHLKWIQSDRFNGNELVPNRSAANTPFLPEPTLTSSKPDWQPAYRHKPLSEK